MRWMASPGALGLVAILSLVTCKRDAPPTSAPTSAARARWTVFDGAAGDLSTRGLDVAPDGAIWASGTAGRFVVAAGPPYSFDLEALPLEDAAQLDLRDVHALAGASVVAMAAGEGARSRVYRSADGGAGWELALANPDPEGFFDAIAFWDAERGVLIGDPVAGRFALYSTTSGGASWSRLPASAAPEALPGEHLFAASGTCIATAGDESVWFGTGGQVARILRSDDRGDTWTAVDAPLAHGADSAGVFSLAFVDARRGIAVGGDYQAPARPEGVAAWTDDGGRSWHAVAPERGPAGYRSAVAFAPAGADPTRPPVAIAVGTSGADISTDLGRSWRPLPGAPKLNAIVFTEDPAVAWAAGPDGTLARVDLGPAAPPE